jgi:hypothetical protein
VLTEIEAVDIFYLVVGAVYALVAGVAAGVFGGHTHHAELVGHDLGHDINHGADPTHPAAQGEVRLSPVSPVTITMVVTAFGDVGLIAIHALALPILLRLRGGMLTTFNQSPLANLNGGGGRKIGRSGRGLPA